MLFRFILLCMAIALLGACANFPDQCHAYGLSSGSSSYARCVNDHHQATEITLLSLANAFTRR
jgi:hypothetical protein